MAALRKRQVLKSVLKNYSFYTDRSLHMDLIEIHRSFFQRRRCKLRKIERFYCRGAVKSSVKYDLVSSRIGEKYSRQRWQIRRHSAHVTSERLATASGLNRSTTAPVLVPYLLRRSKRTPVECAPHSIHSAVGQSQGT